jgi:chemotaxis response regulator CheB
VQETDGDRVVELFKSRNKQPGPLNIDLIIMDLNMPNMDGDEATKEAIFIFIFYSRGKGFYLTFWKFMIC